MSIRSKKSGITAKIIVPITALMAISFGVILYYTYRFSLDASIKSTEEMTKEIINQFNVLRPYYTENVVARVRRESLMKITHDYQNDPKAIPLPATMIHELSEISEQRDKGIKVRLYSDWPFPHRKGRELDDFARRAINFFKVKPDDYFVSVEKMGEKEVVRVALADKLTKTSCVECHNSHPESPKKDWRLGDVRGVLEVTSPLSEQYRSINMLKTIGVIGLFFLVSMLGLLMWVVRKNIKRPFNFLTGKLNGNVTELSSLSEKLAGASGVLSASATEQAGATQRSVSAIEEIVSMITQTKDFAGSGQDLATEIKEKTMEGDRIMQQLVSAMDLIQQANSQLKNMTNIIGDISVKTNVINDIVFKTQLLSFNASIEAARAGQHGKGFAVVAEEVGNLARMSGNAAQEIRELLEDSKTQVAQIVESTQQKVGEGEEVSKKALGIFREISERVGRINEMILRINQATKEQSIGVGQTSQAIGRLNFLAKDTNSIASKASTYSRELNVVSQQISEIARVLQILVLGHRAFHSGNRKKMDEMAEMLGLGSGDQGGEESLFGGPKADLIHSVADEVEKHLEDRLRSSKDFDSHHADFVKMDGDLEKEMERDKEREKGRDKDLGDN